jgi:hypothetical protein
LNAVQPASTADGTWRLDVGWPAAAWTPTVSGARNPQHGLSGLSGLLALPFDAVRALYGTAVECRLVRPSMLASRKLELTLDLLERLSLGPLARSV